MRHWRRLLSESRIALLELGASMGDGNDDFVVTLAFEVDEHCCPLDGMGAYFQGHLQQHV